MHHEQDMRRMGGLKKYMPYTYWTFMAGWLAICGIIPFSGFWSKDEILWNAASTTHIPLGWLVWLVGTIAATCTAFYMTRLMAMTFWGRERFLEAPAGGEADEAHASAYDKGLAAHDATTASAGDRPRHEPGEHVGPVHEDVAHHVATHGHGDHHGAHIPHESPPSMWVPLAVLAILATIGGFVGVGPAFRAWTGTPHPGGHLNISNWLAPIIWNPTTREFNTPEGHEAAAPAESAHAETAAPPVAEGDAEAGHGSAAAVYGDTGFNLAHAVENSTHSELATEWIFILISLVVAGIGMLLGASFTRRSARSWSTAMPAPARSRSPRARKSRNASFMRCFQTRRRCSRKASAAARSRCRSRPTCQKPVTAGCWARSSPPSGRGC
jgi:NADH:ubiquinone oxidoreductase subunit 5 (subunit L)/multisubunit Na+/H+ antiporter MnhA subunit